MTQKQAVRKRLITMARRLQRSGTGTAHAVLRERTATMQAPDLSFILAPLPWAVVGVVATRLYMPERATQGLDVAVRAEDSKAVRQKLESASFRYQDELSVGGSAWLSPDGVPVDVIELYQPWAAQALTQARDNRDPQGACRRCRSPTWC